MTVDERLEKLEKELARAKRRIRWLVDLEKATRAAKGIIQGTTFLLVDSEGRERATLTVTPDGPLLGLADENGKPRAKLTAFKDGPSLDLWDDQGNRRIALHAGKDGPILTLVDENGKGAAGLTVVNKDGPGLVLADEKGKFRARLAVKKNGPALLLIDENGKLRVGLDATKDGPALGLWDENEKPRVKLMATKDGQGLNLCDENEKPRAALVVTKEDGPFLSLYDENGKSAAGLGFYDETDMSAPPTAGGDGSSAENAVLVTASSEPLGVSQEYSYLEQMFGKRDVDWVLEMQVQTSGNGRKHDVLTIRLNDGSMRHFWFDITAFFGRF